ncbi:hypothetical protein IT412_01970 [Candidatus Peregrinibacteria bacterium]|nr:hypothetical protein [Candidatus Peregrinibacteria bacterium]
MKSTGLLAKWTKKLALTPECYSCQKSIQVKDYYQNNCRNTLADSQTVCNARFEHLTANSVLITNRRYIYSMIALAVVGVFTSPLAFFSTDSANFASASVLSNPEFTLNWSAFLPLIPWFSICGAFILAVSYGLGFRNAHGSNQFSKIRLVTQAEDYAG